MTVQIPADGIKVYFADRSCFLHEQFSLLCDGYTHYSSLIHTQLQALRHNDPYPQLATIIQVLRKRRNNSNTSHD